MVMKVMGTDMDTVVMEDTARQLVGWLPSIGPTKEMMVIMVITENVLRLVCYHCINFDLFGITDHCIYFDVFLIR